MLVGGEAHTPCPRERAHAWLWVFPKVFVVRDGSRSRTTSTGAVNRTLRSKRRAAYSSEQPAKNTN